MSKRPASGPLEDVYDAPSPAMKRPKVEDEEMEDSETNGATGNGHLMAPRAPDRDRIDILGADAEEHEELQEAGALDDEDDQPAVAAPKRKAAPEAGYTDLYLDTINRKVLDFDFEKLDRKSVV